MNDYLLKRENGVYNITIEGQETIRKEDFYDIFFVDEMNHALNVGISRKFKGIEFIKYTEAQCLETHLKVYYNKMSKFVYDKKKL